MGRKFAAVVFSMGCLQASTALALGLGELKLESFLNEPLSASVDLLNIDGMHEDEIRVRIGTREDFQRLGLDRSFFLTKIEFDVVVDADGGARILMTTDDPVLEPYLDFIVEARWPSGRLLREYTVLIDPPAFSSATPVVSASQRVEEVEGIPAPGKKKEAVASTGTRVDVRKSDLGPGQMPQRDYNAAASGSPAAGTRYMIKRDDTLWAIAANAKPAGTTVHQTMLDIQRLNPDAFINNNINRVKAGYIVYLPGADDISSADAQAAIAEVNEQNAAWRAGRDAERAAASGPRLRISATEDEAVDTATDAAAGERQAELAALQDNLAQSEMEQADAEGRVSAMQDRVSTLERIVSVKDEQIAALQAALAEAEAAAADAAADMPEETVEEPVEDLGEMAPADDMMADTPAEGLMDEAEPEAIYEEVEEEVVPEEVVEQPVAVAPTPAVKPAPAPEKSGGIMDYILYIIGAAILAILGFFLLRGRGSDEEDFDTGASDRQFTDVELHEPGIDIEEEPSTEDDDLARDLAAAAPAAAEASTRGYGERKHDAYASDVEAADALAEADIYIAYGRHRQAIDLLNNALITEPTNPVYRLKLMEIHTELGNRNDASEQLHQLRSIGDADSLARGEELLASFDSDAGGEPAVAMGDEPAAPATAADEPGLSPNPLGMMDEDADGDFAGLEIEEEEEEGEDLDLSDDFAEEELVIAADSNGMSTKLDLARAYIDMGDDDGARQILEEVVAEGTDELKAEAQALLDRIG